MDDKITTKLLVDVAVLEFLMHSLYVHEFKKAANPAMEAGNLADEVLSLTEVTDLSPSEESIAMAINEKVKAFFDRLAIRLEALE